MVVSAVTGGWPFCSWLWYEMQVKHISFTFKICMLRHAVILFEHFLNSLRPSVNYKYDRKFQLTRKYTLLHNYLVIFQWSYLLHLHLKFGWFFSNTTTQFSMLLRHSQVVIFSHFFGWIMIVITPFKTRHNTKNTIKFIFEIYYLTDFY